MSISKLESLAKTLAADGTFSRADGREVAKASLSYKKVTDTERAQLTKIADTYQDKFDVGGSRALREFMASPSNQVPAPIETMGKDPFVHDQLKDRYIDLVGKATDSIDAAFFQVLDPEIVKSLADASQRGVKVRMVTDDNYFDEQDTMADEQQRVAVKGEANDIYIQLRKVDLTAPDAQTQLQALKTRLDAVNKQIPDVKWPASGTPEMGNAQTYLDAALAGQPVPDPETTLHKTQIEISHELSKDKVLLNYRPAYQQLLDAGVEVHDDNNNALSHNKYMVLDNSVVWGGSYNIQSLLSKTAPTTGLPMTADNAVVMNSTGMAKAFEADFAQMVEGKFHKNKTAEELSGVPVDVDGTQVTPYFSPDPTIPSKLADALNNYLNDYLDRKSKGLATSPPTVRVAAFTMSYKGMEGVVDALGKLKAAGADVQVTLDHMTARASYSAMKPLLDRGIKVDVAHSSVMMHNKFVSVEDGNNGFVRTGSANFTGPAFNENDEHVLKIDSSDVARQYEGYYDALKDNLELKTTDRHANPAPAAKGVGHDDNTVSWS